jgi:lysylphosphatidylglycerol synthetase-like protein (DUF2156 family)
MKKDFVYWTPRILSIIFICFLTLFSLDVFESTNGFWQILLGLLIHNIPSFILIIVLAISWKREIVGGITFILAGLLYLVFIFATAIENGFEYYYLVWALQISGISFLIGILFFICWKRKQIR